MPDVLIHRCTLRLVRRVGWSWGPDPKRMLQDVVHAFPAMLAKKLEELFPEEHEQEFAAPLRIRIPVRFSDLVSESVSPPQGAFASESRTSASMEEKLDSVLRRVFGLELPAATAQTLSNDRFAPPVPSEETQAEQVTHHAGAIARALIKWHRAGLLTARLASLADDEIEGWHSALWHKGNAAAAPCTQNGESIEQQALDLARAHEKTFSRGDRAGRLRLRVTVAAAIAAHLHTSLKDARILAAVEGVVPLEARAVAGAPLVGINHEETAKPSTLGKSKVPLKRAPAPEWDVHVECALPFLLLRPLTKLGYLDALGGVLEASDLASDAPLFASALAHKVLAAPERGWRRTPASIVAASAFAGRQEPVSNEALVGFSRRIGSHITFLDQILTDALIRGHPPGDPLLLCRADSENTTGFLLLDTDGCFPVAWHEAIDQFLPLLRSLGNSIVLVSREAAGPRVLKTLDEAGVRFISDVSPIRGETWQRIQQGPVQLGWTNHTDHDSIPVLEAARNFAAFSDDAAALWETFGVARPGIARDPLRQLETTLTLASAVAAGMIAWQLWRSRGRTTPQMVVERFCDLDGRIRFGPKSVNVLLPLGRRHQELLQGGLLNPVRDIPWLGSRQVELGGG